MNKVVARFQDGRVLKGKTSDFLPAKAIFHLLPDGETHASKPQELAVSDLKALFFVKDLDGNPEHRKTNDFDPAKPAPGRKVRIEFKDGEVVVGTTQGYQPGRPGFFIVPADARSNNERCYIVTAATRQVTLL